jgi:hypothetical protein
MKKLLVTATIFSATANAACPTSVSASQALEELSKAHPSIKWDRDSMVCADFDGDKHVDQAVIGLNEKMIFVAIRSKALSKSQVLEFSVGRGIQAAICELPAKLEIDTLECQMEDGALPGCKASKLAKSLDLIDGQCDSIHMYWNHKKNAMVWWRR